MRTSMEKANKILRLVLLLAFSMLRPSQQQFPQIYVPRPLCRSQFILVNHACVTLPYTGPRNSEDDDDESEPINEPEPVYEPEPVDEPEPDDEPEYTDPLAPPEAPAIPVSPGFPEYSHSPPEAPGLPESSHTLQSPASPPPSPIGADVFLSSRQRRRRHRRQSPAEQECCHWVRAVDNDCVCDILVHLPLFLSRPVHHYTVVVDGSCTVTFTCTSRIKI